MNEHETKAIVVLHDATDAFLDQEWAELATNDPWSLVFAEAELLAYQPVASE